MSANFGMLGWVCRGAAHFASTPTYGPFPAHCDVSQCTAYQLSTRLVSLGLQVHLNLKVGFRLSLSSVAGKRGEI